MESSILLFPLFQDREFITNGEALSESSLDLDVAKFRTILPRCAGLFLIVNTQGLPGSTYMEWNVGFYTGFDRNREKGTRYDIAATSFSANGAERSVEYTTTANFLLESRPQAWWRNKAGISGVYSCRASAVLGARLQT